MGISRQAYYQGLKREQVQAQEQEMVLAWVRKKRQRHPRMGGRKLLFLLHKERVSLMGRDAFFSLLRTHKLLLERKRRYARTTESGSLRFKNLSAEVRLTRAHQVWVSDITYLETEQGFVYVSLVSDAYSRKIIGHHVSNSLCVEGSLCALKQAQRQKVKKVIHHSDRGIQYTCKAYRAQLSRYKMRSSMGATGNCYDNAKAERINGILKQEYGLYHRFANLAEAKKAVNEAVYLYNYERPHSALQYRTPQQVHYENTINIPFKHVNLF
jgi:transposase InsO family protein